MKTESCLTTFLNGDDIVDIGFSEWAIEDDQCWRPVGTTTFVLPSDGNRVVVELPIGCVEWQGGPWPAGGSFTIQAGRGAPTDESFIPCQRLQVAPVSHQRTRFIDGLLGLVGIKP